MKNILIIGEARDLYRTQTFVKCVLDKYTTFHLTYISIKAEYKPASNFIKKVFGKIHRTVDKLIRHLFIAYQLLYADVVYIPAMNLVSVNLLKWALLLKRKIVAEYYISMFDTFVLDRGALKEDDTAAIRYRKFDTILQKFTDVIYLNRTEAARYAQLSGLSLQDLKYRIIPLAVQERSKAKLRYFKEGGQSFNVVWWGTYIPLHGLEKLMEVFSIISKLDKDCYFYILGNSEESAAPYKEFAEKNGLTDRIIVRNDISFSNGRLEEFIIENCSLALGVFGDSEKARSVIVNKAVEAVGMKVPVLTQYSDAFSEFFTTGKNIFMCRPAVEDIVESIMSIKAMTADEISMMVNEAYDIFNANFSTNAAYKAYERLLNDYSE